jgi:hypothetical protein
MTVPPTVLAIDLIEGLFHLGHIRRRTGIQRLLHHRLLGAGRPTKGALQRRIGPQKTIDFHQAMRTRQHADEAIVEFVARCIFHRLLRDPHPCSNGVKQLHLLHFQSNGRQAGGGAKHPVSIRGRFCHDDGSPLLQFDFCKRYAPSSRIWQVPGSRQATASNLDEI